MSDLAGFLGFDESFGQVSIAMPDQGVLAEAMSSRNRPEGFSTLHQQTLYPVTRGVCAYGASACHFKEIA